jgi:hypothetical protein
MLWLENEFAGTAPGQSQTRGQGGVKKIYMPAKCDPVRSPPFAKQSFCKMARRPSAIEPIGRYKMLQRGRKGRLSRSVIPIAPHIVVDQPPRDRPPAPELLDPAEKETWDAIMREQNINYAGRMLLEMALTSIGRARVCRSIINRDGELIAGRRGLPRAIRF